MKTTIASVALLLVMFTVAWGQYQVGDPVDDFTLLNAQGQPVSLSDFPNQIIFMTFWETG